MCPGAGSWLPWCPQTVDPSSGFQGQRPERRLPCPGGAQGQPVSLHNPLAPAGAGAAPAGGDPSRHFAREPVPLDNTPGKAAGPLGLTPAPPLKHSPCITRVASPPSLQEEIPPTISPPKAGRPRLAHRLQLQEASPGEQAHALKMHHSSGDGERAEVGGKGARGYAASLNHCN